MSESVSLIRARFYAALEQGLSHDKAVAIANGASAVAQGATEPTLGLTREGIAAMGKTEVSKLLDAHGVEFDKRLGVETLREMLLGAVFVDL